MSHEPWWRPERFAAKRAHLETRGRVIAAIRHFFAGRGFVEVDTPALQVSPGLEPHLMAFATELVEPGEGPRPRFLHTSPEFAMKKLLVAGDCEALLAAALAASGRPHFTWAGRSADPARPWQYLSVPEAFARFCGIDLLATAPEPLAPSLDLLAEAARPLGIAAHEGDHWEDLFFRIFLERIEPLLGVGAPTILYDYPIAMAALARAKPEDSRLAERFELYVCGLELANAFGELTDAAAQRRRFLADQERKRARYGVAYPVDEDFLAALAHGMVLWAPVA